MTPPNATARLAPTARRAARPPYDRARRAYHPGATYAQPLHAICDAPPRHAVSMAAWHAATALNEASRASGMRIPNHRAVNLARGLARHDELVVAIASGQVTR